MNFLAEVQNFLVRGMPNIYKVANLKGDGNCLIYTAVCVMNLTIIPILWFGKKKNKKKKWESKNSKTFIKGDNS